MTSPTSVPRPQVPFVRAVRTLAFALLPGVPALAQDCSVSFAGGDASGASLNRGNLPSLSADGSKVAYSQLTTLDHVFLHDLETGQRVQVDTSSDGSPIGGDAGAPALSANGRVVAFTSTDAAPAAGTQVYVKDLASGLLQIASVMPDGTPQPPALPPPGSGSSALSADGRRVVFTSSAFGLVAGKTSVFRDVFVRDLQAGVTTRILSIQGAEPDGDAAGAAISASGRYVAFASAAENLVPGDTNELQDVFVHDLATGVTERVSVAHGGGNADARSGQPAVSADGRFVVFVSNATNLVAGGADGAQHVFLRDRALGTTELVDVSSAGVVGNFSAQGFPSISAGGERVVFHSHANNLVSTPVSGGRLYLRDRAAGTTELLLDPPAAQPDDRATSISADGGSIAFAQAMPFGPGDNNMDLDVFLRRCEPAAPRAYCPAPLASIGCRERIGWSGSPSASAGAGFVLSTQDSVSGQPGLLAYSTVSGDLRPLGTNFLCLRPPVRRGSALSSGGPTQQLDCSGAFAFDFNTWIATGIDPALAAGTLVWAQFWSRDPDAVGSAHLSDAVTFEIGP